jgi:hypothetical protein
VSKNLDLTIHFVGHFLAFVFIYVETCIYKYVNMIGMSAFLRLLCVALAGVGFTELADRFLSSKVSGYEPVSPGLKLGRKLAIFLGCMVGGGIAWNFISRKFHILTPRHASRSRKSKRR